MMKSLSAALALTLLAGAAQAHEIWVERDGAGPARVYLGEPNEVAPPEGDAEFPKLQAPVVFQADPAKAATLTRKANHIEAAVSGKGDVRAKDDNIFKPWNSKDGLTAGVFYGRAGRTETATVMDLEIAPVTAGGNTFVVVFKGKAVADVEVDVINPGLWSKGFKTDAEGKITVPVTDKGRYLLGVHHAEKAAATINGVEVAKVAHTATLTFNN